jgi:hypothetical protein
VEAVIDNVKVYTAPEVPPKIDTGVEPVLLRAVIVNSSPFAAIEPRLFAGTRPVAGVLTSTVANELSARSSV